VTTVQVLRRALELLNTVGWGQLTYGGPRQGCYCAAGACNAAATSGWAHVKNLASADAQAALERAVGAKPGMLIPWNDKKGRTKDDVVGAFSAAIAAEEARS
jgi:hypothetical protein